MEEDKKVTGNPASNTDQFKPVAEPTEITEDDLEQVSGGVPGNVSYGVQKDKMKSANKNADQVKGLL